MAYLLECTLSEGVPQGHQVRASALNLKGTFGELVNHSLHQLHPLFEDTYGNFHPGDINFLATVRDFSARDECFYNEYQINPN